MKFEFNDAKLGSHLGFTNDIKKYQNQFSVQSGNIYMLWNRNNLPLELYIDGMPIELLPDQLVTTTYLQHVSYEKTELPLTAFHFNREFYCINSRHVYSP